MHVYAYKLINQLAGILYKFLFIDDQSKVFTFFFYYKKIIIFKSVTHKLMKPNVNGIVTFSKLIEFIASIIPGNLIIKLYLFIFYLSGLIY